jgi:hypothetical protein
MLAGGGVLVLAVMAVGVWLDGESRSNGKPRPSEVRQAVVLPYEPDAAGDDYEQIIERLRVLEEDAQRRLREVRGDER